MTELFRKEATPTLAGDWLGKAGIPVPRGQRAVALALAFCTAALLALACLAKYQRHSSHPAAVTYSYPPQVLSAPADGVITSVQTEEGTAIHANSVIAHLRLQNGSPPSDDGIDLTAPVSGSIVRISAHPGDFVGRGQPIAALASDGTRLVVKFRISGRDLPYATPDSVVRIRYPTLRGRDSEPQAGRIIRIQPLLNVNDDDSYEVTASLPSETISVADHPVPLSSGTRATVDIMLDRRSILNWLTD